jgi:polyketide cyclase/dehydrase/lipid transport protein
VNFNSLDTWTAGVPRTFGSGPSDPMCLADEPGTWVERDVAATPSTLWEIVTDINLPSHFSDEFLGATWTHGGPAIDASFIGRSQHAAIGSWEVESFVIAFDVERSFGWVTVDRSLPGSTWRFDITPRQSGSRLRFAMSMGPGPSGISLAIEAMPEKEPRILAKRILEHHANMVRTVEGIKSMAEKVS